VEINQAKMRSEGEMTGSDVKNGRSSEYEAEVRATGRPKCKIIYRI
jgi:hypothetical protein